MRQENPRPPIATAWSGQLVDIFHAGDLIESAKLELPHGEYLKMVKDELPFKRQAAAKLMAISTSDNLRNVSPEIHLPVGWTILYELTRLSGEQFETAIAAGSIHPKMTRKDAKTLRGEPEAKPKVPPLAKCFQAVDRALATAMRDLPKAEWQDMLSQLRMRLDDIDIKGFP